MKVATWRMQHMDLHEGAYNTLWAATSAEKSVLQSGGAYEAVGKRISPTKQSADKALAKDLWEWTEKELAAFS